MRCVVYTIVNKTNGKTQKVIIMNVKALSGYDAERKILDNFFTGINSAIAYDMDNVKEMEYAARHFVGARVIDYKDFIVKAKEREAKIQAIDKENI